MSGQETTLALSNEDFKSYSGFLDIKNIVDNDIHKEAEKEVGETTKKRGRPSTKKE